MRGIKMTIITLHILAMFGVVFFMLLVGLLAILGVAFAMHKSDYSPANPITFRQYLGWELVAMGDSLTQPKK